MRIVLAMCGLLFSSLALAIDLDRPGAMEALARDNPAHHAKVEKILSEAPYRPYAAGSGPSSTRGMSIRRTC